MTIDIPLMKTGKLDAPGEGEPAHNALSNEAHLLAMDSSTKSWKNSKLLKSVAEKDEDEVLDLTEMVERAQRGEILPVDPIAPPPLGNFHHEWHPPFDWK